MGESAQELVDQFTGGELADKIMDAVDEIQGGLEPFAPLKREAQEFLDQEVTATVWHGTRRKESIEQLKRDGFCSYTEEQAVNWLAEASEKLAEETKVGPRTAKYMGRIKTRVLHEVLQPYRGKFSVTGIEEAACGEYPTRLDSGWASRNPEFMWDFLHARTITVTRGKEITDEILTEMFDDPMKVKLRIKVKLRQLLGPQDIHLEQRCFRPEEIVSIEKC